MRTHPQHGIKTSLTQHCRLVEHKPLSKAVELGAADTLKIILTTQDGKTAKRPHQAFLLLKDVDTGLDISYPFTVKDSGKAKLELVGIPCVVSSTIADVN